MQLRLHASRALAAAAISSVLVCSATANAHEGAADHDHGASAPAPAEEPAAPAEAPLDPQPAGSPAAAPPAEAPPAPAPATTPRPPADPDRRSDDDPPRRVGITGDTSQRIADNDWRRRARGGGDGVSWLELGHFVFEMRFGGYGVSVVEAIPDAGLFINDDLNFYFGLEADWLPVHIPYVGSVGLAYGFGFTSTSGNLRKKSDGSEVDTETSLAVYPMHTSAVLRVDGPLRELGIPVVPHLKFGLGFAPWSWSNVEVDAADGSGSTLEDISGMSAGLHIAIGGSIALNAFDQSAANAMYEDTGIRYTYLFGEWMLDDFGGIGASNQLPVGGTGNFAIGLALDW